MAKVAKKTPAGKRRVATKPKRLRTPVKRITAEERKDLTRKPTSRAAECAARRAAREALAYSIAQDFLLGFTAHDVGQRNGKISTRSAHGYKRRFLAAGFSKEDPRRDVRNRLAALDGTVELELIQARLYQHNIVIEWRKGAPVTQIAASIGVLPRIARAAVYLATQDGSAGGIFQKT